MNPELTWRWFIVGDRGRHHHRSLGRPAWGNRRNRPRAPRRRSRGARRESDHESLASTRKRSTTETVAARSHTRIRRVFDTGRSQKLGKTAARGFSLLLAPGRLRWNPTHGEVNRLASTVLPTYWFHLIVRARLRSIYRDAENAVRLREDQPAASEGWVSEVALLRHIRDAFPEKHVVHQGRPEWLALQSFDIYFPVTTSRSNIKVCSMRVRSRGSAVKPRTNVNSNGTHASASFAMKTGAAS